jgi:hypothetical protein
MKINDKKEEQSWISIDARREEMFIAVVLLLGYALGLLTIYWKLSQ